jgi:molybdenum cofactor synthesis domain-containing protein
VTGSRPRTAAIIAVGDELLSGKVCDTNVALLTEELRALGTPLREVRIIADDLETIARTFRDVCPRFDHVFSSGGVGPTHDDLTLPGLAQAFGESLVRNARLAEAIEGFYGQRTNEHLLRMADLPESAVLLDVPGLPIPVVTVRNIYVLPGEPTIFRMKFLAMREHFRQPAFHLRRLFTSLEEGEIAGLLGEVQERIIGVAVGSYPRYADVDYKVMVTFESTDAEACDAALACVRDAISAEAVLRVD